MDLREQLQETLGDSLILEDELGGGGMSRVFVAHEPSLGRKVVVKVLPPDMSHAVSIDRFRREIQLAAQLQHPHIVPLLAAGETNGLPYFTMPYVRGESLRSRLTKDGELPISEAVRILRELASAIAYAHQNGIVHRDIKPENILISGGSAVITDFGVAKALTASSTSGGSAGLTSLGVALGTPAYMAPEQATADPGIDGRADIYSLGIVGYEMLTGVTPFGERSAQAMLAAHVHETPEPIAYRRPSVPPALAALIMRCLEKHAADRPQSAAQLMQELDSLSTPSGGMAPTFRVPAAAGKRTRLTMGLSAVIVLALFALAFLAAQQMQRKRLAEKPEAVPAIVVLPFENVGPSEGQDFADGMTEEITNRLSSLKGLRVIGRQSAKSYTGSTKTPQQIGNDLKVEYILTGSVRWDASSEGKRIVRVSPALLRANDGTQLWSEAYQTVVAGMFDVQSKVATQVANSLNLTLLTPEKDAITTRPTSSPEAYTRYLRGKQLIEGNTTIAPIRDGLRLLTEATEEDSKFLQAWAWLSIAHTEMFWYAGDKTQQRLDLAVNALKKAEALERSSPDVHLARGVLLYHGRRDLEGALKEFQATLSSRPSDVNAIVFTAAIDRRLGKWADAIEEWKRAVDLEPKNAGNLIELTNTLLFVRNYAEAERFVDQAIILDASQPEAYRMKSIIALEGRGNVPEAIEHLRVGRSRISGTALTYLLQSMTWPAMEDPDLRRYLANVSPNQDIPLGVFYANKLRLFYYLGDSVRARAYGDSAQRTLEAEIAASPDPGLFYEQLATVHATRGHRAEALRALAKADELRPSGSDAFGGSDRENTRLVIYTLLHDDDAALAQMQKRVDIDGGMSRVYLRRDPIFNRFVSNPRYRRIVGL